MKMHFELIEGIPDYVNHLCLVKYNSFFISRVYILSHYKEEDIYSVIQKSVDRHDPEEVYIVLKNKKSLHVLNKLVSINSDDVESLVSFLRETFKGIKFIKFEMLLNRLNLNRCYSYYNNSDICVDLPDDTSKYNMQLGSKSRQHYKYYRKKIGNDFENVEFVINKRYEIDDSFLIDKLIELKNIRCEKKYVVNHALHNKQIIKKLAKEFGLLSYVLVNDTPICILLFYKVGTEYFFEQTAFDDNYYKYSIGRTILYWSIIDAIEHNSTKFHFLWKGADYKNHYSATEYKLFDSIVFNSKGVNYYTTIISKKIHTLLRNIKHSKIGSRLLPIYNKIVYPYIK